MNSYINVFSFIILKTQDTYENNIESKLNLFKIGFLCAILAVRELGWP